jgi:hypothetical protein
MATKGYSVFPDFCVANHGTIFLLTPHTRGAREWLAEHIPDDAQWWGNGTLVVEHRFIQDIVSHLQEDGFIVR